LITAVPCPETEDRFEAQRMAVQNDGHVEAWHAALKLALATEDENMIQNAEDELDLAVEISVDAWTALARCTLEDLKVWRKKLVRLDEGLSRGETKETKVSIWK
jgi:predicted negative regulator of RcsB-dependent stress response